MGRFAIAELSRGIFGRIIDRRLYRILPFCAVIALLLSACANTATRQIEQLTRTDLATNIVMMPLDVELAELSAAGLHVPRADWTRAAHAHLADAIRERKREMNLVIGDFDDSALSLAKVDSLNQIKRLHGAVGRAAFRHHYQPPARLPSKQGAFDWTLGPSVQTLRQATGADYALFIHLRDSYSSSGRVAVIVLAAMFGVAIEGGQQVGFASLVDLESGDIVWFNFLFRDVGDLRTLDAAKETAAVLLKDFPQ